MAVIVDIVSTREGWHVVQVGMNADEISDFRIQCWITKYGHRMIDVMQPMGLNFITFLRGDLWIHNDETQDRCNLFGEKRDCIVQVVANEDPMTIKVLDSMDVHSNSTWEITSVTVAPSINHPDGMSSKIPSEQFKRRSGVWRAKFLRNMKSTSEVASVREALQGEPLRGSEALLTLKNTSNSQVKLFKISVNMTSSRI